MFNFIGIFKNTAKNKEENLALQISEASNTIAGAIENMNFTLSNYIDDTRVSEKTIDWQAKFIAVYEKCLSEGPNPKVSESRRRTYIRQVQSFLNELKGKVYSSIIDKKLYLAPNGEKFSLLDMICGDAVIPPLTKDVVQELINFSNERLEEVENDLCLLRLWYKINPTAKKINGILSQNLVNTLKKKLAAYGILISKQENNVNEVTIDSSFSSNNNDKVAKDDGDISDVNNNNNNSLNNINNVLVNEVLMNSSISKDDTDINNYGDSEDNNSNDKVVANEDSEDNNADTNEDSEDNNNNNSLSNINNVLVNEVSMNSSISNNNNNNNDKVIAKDNAYINEDSDYNNNNNSLISNINNDDDDDDDHELSMDISVSKNNNDDDDRVVVDQDAGVNDNSVVDKDDADINNNEDSEDNNNNNNKKKEVQEDREEEVQEEEEEDDADNNNSNKLTHNVISRKRSRRVTTQEDRKEEEEEEDREEEVQEAREEEEEDDADNNNSNKLRRSSRKTSINTSKLITHNVSSNKKLRKYVAVDIKKQNNKRRTTKQLDVEDKESDDQADSSSVDEIYSGGNNFDDAVIEEVERILNTLSTAVWSDDILYGEAPGVSYVQVIWSSPDDQEAIAKVIEDLIRKCLNTGNYYKEGEFIEHDDEILHELKRSLDYGSIFEFEFSFAIKKKEDTDQKGLKLDAEKWNCSSHFIPDEDNKWAFFSYSYLHDSFHRYMTLTNWAFILSWTEYFLVSDSRIDDDIDDSDYTIWKRDKIQWHFTFIRIRNRIVSTLISEIRRSASAIARCFKKNPSESSTDEDGVSQDY